MSMTGKVQKVAGLYIKGTLNYPLILRSDNTNIVKWWTDASYGVHEDMKSHTGGVMTL